jgi:hypothetical protein
VEEDLQFRRTLGSDLDVKKQQQLSDKVPSAFTTDAEEEEHHLLVHRYRDGRSYGRQKNLCF